LREGKKAFSTGRRFSVTIGKGEKRNESLRQARGKGGSMFEKEETRATSEGEKSFSPPP